MAAGIVTLHSGSHTIFVTENSQRVKLRSIHTIGGGVERCRAIFGGSLPLFGFFGIAEDFFADDAFSGFVEIFIQGRFDLKEFWPEGAVDERGRGSQDDGRIALARVAVGVQAISAAERQKEPPVPTIREPEVHFDGFFGSLRGGDGGPNPLDGGLGCIALSGSGCAFKEGCYLAEFLAEFLFCGQKDGPWGLGVNEVGSLMTKRILSPGRSERAFRRHSGVVLSRPCARKKAQETGLGDYFLVREKENADPSTHHPQPPPQRRRPVAGDPGTEERLGPRSLRMTDF